MNVRKVKKRGLGSRNSENTGQRQQHEYLCQQISETLTTNKHFLTLTQYHDHKLFFLYDKHSTQYHDYKLSHTYAIQQILYTNVN